jgi:hypothetical protein
MKTERLVSFNTKLLSASLDHNHDHPKLHNAAWLSKNSVTQEVHDHDLPGTRVPIDYNNLVRVYQLSPNQSIKDAFSFTIASKIEESLP